MAKIELELKTLKAEYGERIRLIRNKLDRNVALRGYLEQIEKLVE